MKHLYSNKDYLPKNLHQASFLIRNVRGITFKIRKKIKMSTIKISIQNCTGKTTRIARDIRQEKKERTYIFPDTMFTLKIPNNSIRNNKAIQQGDWLKDQAKR